MAGTLAEQTRDVRACAIRLFTLAVLLAGCATPAQELAEAPARGGYDAAPASCSDRPEAHPELDLPLQPGAIDPVLFDRAVRL